MMKRLRDEVRTTQVVLIAGGMGKRMGSADKPKCLIELAGKPLIDWAIEYFASNGFERFILLVGYRGEDIVRYVGDGSRYGVRVSYSFDPETPGTVGKAKAFKNALMNGAIDREVRSIVAFPDDIFLDRSLPLRVLLSHIESVRRGALATVVLATGYRVPFGVAKVSEEGYVLSFEEKPLLNVYVNTGMYVMEPSAYDYVMKLVDLTTRGPIELEETVLPALARERKLAYVTIPATYWVPVNTIKDLENAEKALNGLRSTLARGP